MSLLVYTACNGVPTFASTRLLFGNQRQTVGIRLSTYPNFRPFQSSVRPRLRGFSPYTAALHNHQQPAPLRTFPRLYVRAGFLLFIPSFPTRTLYTASTPWEVSVCPFAALPAHLSNTISVVSADFCADARASADPAFRPAASAAGLQAERLARWNSSI